MIPLWVAFVGILISAFAIPLLAPKVADVIERFIPPPRDPGT